MSYHHGLTITESASGPRALAALSAAVIGLIATATTTASANVRPSCAVSCRANATWLSPTTIISCAVMSRRSRG